MKRICLVAVSSLAILVGCVPPPQTGEPGSTTSTSTTSTSTTTTTTTTVQPPPPSDRLNPNETLRTNQSRQSGDGRYLLIMQTDGNLVLYAPGSQPIWASNTAGNPGAWTIMQASDGNLVVYSAANKPLWASNTAGNPGAYLAVQNDSNLVIYNGARPIWARFGLGLWFPLRGSWVIGCTWNNGCSGGYHGYDAIDIARNPSGSIGGDPIYAAGRGVVHIISRSTACGGSGTIANHVQVDHGGGQTSEYYHLATIAVSEGQTVDENTVLGRQDEAHRLGRAVQLQPPSLRGLPERQAHRPNTASVRQWIASFLPASARQIELEPGSTWTTLSNQGLVC